MDNENDNNLPPVAHAFAPTLYDVAARLLDITDDPDLVNYMHFDRACLEALTCTAVLEILDEVFGEPAPFAKSSEPEGN